MFVWGGSWDEAMEAEDGDDGHADWDIDADIDAGGPCFEASELPRELGADLVPLPLAARQAPKDVSSCTPAAILHAALIKDHPELNFPPDLRRCRLKGKSMPDGYLGEILARLQADVNATLRPWQASWQLRRNAFHEYVLDCSELLGMSRKTLRNALQEHWSNASVEVKDRWAFIRKIRERLYAVEYSGACKRRTRIPFPEGCQPPQSANVRLQAEATSVAIGKGIGLLRTFNTSWHNDVAELSQIMARDMSLQEKLAALQNLPFLQEKYRQYKEDVRSHARKHGLRSWGCCFEVSLQAKNVGRVHLHDYIGPSLDFWGWDEVKRVVEFQEEDRCWNDIRGFCNFTSARGNVNHRKLKAVAWALYYVSGAKLGSIFSDSRPKPFEDPPGSLPGPTAQILEIEAVPRP